MKCDKADTFLVLGDDFSIKPFKRTAGRRVVAQVVHLEKIVERFNDDEAYVTVFGQNLVEFLEMVVGGGGVKNDNRVVLPHATLYEIFTSILVSGCVPAH